ncbi:Oidioi.mRNA.OKI2018_I69.chr2.g4053.t1.cds [Oikopleura dioica]|uniref:Oidioi.mRNA.OKI2018_I69.chr2.g4053.t1.cds n=1 Tax=Oikopleura dioica TaxID=34765 RepID=A0ABN7T0C5_OIKDI|nr:Oidioi.mRNA.OKI2018_I69.chr2.g4053.t1.cds [Oikopleura dioica]
MPAEVLIHYSRQKKFVVGRLFGWVLILATFATLISLSGVIIAQSPPCLDFWEKSPIYQIYPRSFKDCDPDLNQDREDDICGDGIGDIPGIIEKLDYLKDDLGISVVWVSPIFMSPMQDFGYDVSDYRQPDPVFGNMKDLQLLISEMHNRGMKLVLDFVPNHTSVEHAKFQNVSEAANFYVWRDGDKPKTAKWSNRSPVPKSPTPPTAPAPTSISRKKRPLARTTGNPFSPSTTRATCPPGPSTPKLENITTADSAGSKLI